MLSLPFFHSRRNAAKHPRRDSTQSAVNEASERRYLAERELANARNSKLLSLADAVAGTQIQREEEK